MGVLLAGVCLIRTNGEIALAPYLGILGRGVHQVHGQWGSIVSAVGPTLGTTLLVSRQPRDRMGFCGPARQHARHKLEWNVYRICRSLMDWGGIYGAFGAGPTRESGLLREAHRAWARHGRLRDALRKAERTALSRPSGFTLQHRFLSSSYTMFAAARIGSRGLRTVQLFSSPSFGMVFEVA
jgi:hypothetical protein